MPITKLFKSTAVLLVIVLAMTAQSYKPRIDRDLDAVGTSGGAGASIAAGPSDCLAINTGVTPNEIDLASPVMPCRTYIDNSDAQTISAAATTIDTTARSALLTNSSGATVTISNAPSLEAGEYEGQLFTACALTNNIIIQDETNLSNSDVRNGGYNLVLEANGGCKTFIYRNAEWHTAPFQQHVVDRSPCTINVAGTIAHIGGWTFPSVNPATTAVVESSSHRWCGIAFANAAPVDIGGFNTPLDDWDGGNILIRYMWTVSAGGTNGQDIKLSFETAFVSAGDDLTTFSFNAAQTRTIDIPQAGTTNSSYQDAFFLTTTNAVKNDMMLVRITRDAGDAADTLAADVRIIKVTIAY